MKTILFPAAAAALLALSPLAASARTTGVLHDAVVKSVNASALTVQLNDGNTYGVETGALFNKLQPGTHVDVRWADINGGSVITRANDAG